MFGYFVDICWYLMSHGQLFGVGGFQFHWFGWQHFVWMQRDFGCQLSTFRRATSSSKFTLYPLCQLRRLCVINNQENLLKAVTGPLTSIGLAEEKKCLTTSWLSSGRGPVTDSAHWNILAGYLRVCAKWTIC